MDLGIAGKTALVCASSEGLGKACAVSLSREGVHVFINGRTLETLEATADEIRAEGGEVTDSVLVDIAGTPFGSSAIPHFGQSPGPPCSISGCIGHVNTASSSMRWWSWREPLGPSP